MVKRKATESLDEWLKEGELAAAARRENTETVTETDNPVPNSTAESVPPHTANETPTVAPAEVEVSSDEASSWFWTILEQSGYELS